MLNILSLLLLMNTADAFSMDRMHRGTTDLVELCTLEPEPNEHEVVFEDFENGVYGVVVQNRKVRFEGLRLEEPGQIYSIFGDVLLVGGDFDATKRQQRRATKGAVKRFGEPNVTSEDKTSVLVWDYQPFMLMMLDFDDGSMFITCPDTTIMGR